MLFDSEQAKLSKVYFKQNHIIFTTLNDVNEYSAVKDIIAKNY